MTTSCVFCSTRITQELNALTQLDEKALEAADAEAALAAAARLTSNIRDVEDSYVADVDASNARERQRVRLLDRRRLEAEFQTRCVYLILFGVYFLFLFLFLFRIGNWTDDVFCLPLTGCCNGRLTSRGLGSKGTRSCTAPRWPPAS